MFSFDLPSYISIL